MSTSNMSVKRPTSCSLVMSVPFQVKEKAVMIHYFKQCESISRIHKYNETILSATANRNDVTTATLL